MVRVKILSLIVHLHTSSVNMRTQLNIEKHGMNTKSIDSTKFKDKNYKLDNLSDLLALMISEIKLKEDGPFKLAV